MASASPPPLLLLLDWDNTLTRTTTLPLIASVATHPLSHPSLPSLSAAYARDLLAHDAAYRPPRAARTTVALELAYLNSLRVVERASVERVEAAGIFRGVKAADVEDVAGAVGGRGGCLRVGVEGLLRRVGQGGGSVAVVSVAWSRRFIHRVLCEWARLAGAEGVRVGEVGVWANEIVDDGSGRLDRVFGGAEGGLWTAGDKARAMDGIEAAIGADPSAMRTVYIGDSPTDLACLLKADVGICIRDGLMTGEQRGLQETLDRIRVECVHVGAFEEKQAGDGRKRLWWAKDFDEVCQSGVAGKLPEMTA